MLCQPHTVTSGWILLASRGFNIWTYEEISSCIDQIIQFVSSHHAGYVNNCTWKEKKKKKREKKKELISTKKTPSHKSPTTNWPTITSSYEITSPTEGWKHMHFITSPVHSLNSGSHETSHMTYDAARLATRHRGGWWGHFKIAYCNVTQHQKKKKKKKGWCWWILQYLHKMLQLVGPPERVHKCGLKIHMVSRKVVFHHGYCYKFRAFITQVLCACVCAQPLWNQKLYVFQSPAHLFHHPQMCSDYTIILTI